MKIVDYKYDDNNLRTHKTIDLGAQVSNLFGTQSIANAEIDYVWKGNKLIFANIQSIIQLSQRKSVQKLKFIQEIRMKQAKAVVMLRVNIALPHLWKELLILQKAKQN